MYRYSICAQNTFTVNSQEYQNFATLYWVGYTTKWWIWVSPFGKPDILICPKIHLDLGYFYFIPCKNTGYDIMSKKVDMTHSCIMNTEQYIYCNIKQNRYCAIYFDSIRVFIVTSRWMLIVQRVFLRQEVTVTVNFIRIKQDNQFFMEGRQKLQDSLKNIP